MNISRTAPANASNRGVFSVRHAVLLIVAGGVLTAGVLAGLLLHLRSDALSSSYKLLTAVAQLTDEQTSRTLQSVERSLQSVETILAAAALSSVFPSLLPSPDNARGESIDDQLHKIVAVHPYLTVIRVLDAQGRAIYGSDTGNTGMDLSDRAYFTDRRDGRENGFRFDRPIRNRVANKWVIPATLTVRAANGDFAGVIVGAVDPLFFDHVWSLDEKIPKLTVTLFRTDGVMLMRSPVEESLIGKAYSSGTVFRMMATGLATGTFQNISGFDGEMRLFAFRQLHLFPGLVLVIGQAEDQALAAWWRIAWIVAAGWALATLVVGALTLWLVREWKVRRSAQARYQVLFDASPYPTIALDHATRRFLAVSAAAIEQYGWSREELLAMSSDDIYPPEDLLKIKAMRPDLDLKVTRFLRGLRHHKKDGSIIDVEMTLRPIDLDGRPAYLATATDVTERLLGENARLAAESAREIAESACSVTEGQLRQSQKMEAVGQLTGGIAHDFNNLLFVILANTDALQEEQEISGAELTKRLDQISRAVLRAADLTRQLLAFSRKQTLSPKPTDLNDLVSSTGKLLRRALGEQIVIESRLAGGLWTVDIDRAQLETALVNLCVNARDAMPGGGKLLIESRNITLDWDSLPQAPKLRAGDYAMLAVTDTGCGMSPETRAKVFEPFFTTKEVGKGTGLGLSMVYGFIKQSKGYITIQSEVGRGTTFRLYLPRSAGVQEAEPAQPAAPMPRGSERILVVEDESQVCASIVEQLQSLGYSVGQASDGAAGLAAIEAAPQPYDLVLTDLVMPGLMSGKALADEIVRRWPGTKVVFLSGYAKNVLLRDGMPAAGVLLLSKPFRKLDLALTVRRALDAGPDKPDTEWPKAA